MVKKTPAAPTGPMAELMKSSPAVFRAEPGELVEGTVVFEAQ